MNMYKDEKVVGRLHSVETMGLLDGPGVRTIFFLQGCPLRCAYCHNPDSQAINAGEEVTPEDILKIAKRYRPYQGEDGGVTFSGGEPLLQGAFLAQTLQLLKKEGFNTCVDTSGYGQPQYYPEILPYVDTLLLDVKAFDEKSFREICGASMQGFLNFMTSLADNGFDGQIWLRHVMLPGYTDNAEAMEQLVETIKPIQFMVERLEIIPYHTHGTAKYEQLGLEYALSDLAPMEQEQAKEWERYANRLHAQQLSASRNARS
jgi:pyruvate formate lyase activating enzyme